MKASGNIISTVTYLWCAPKQGTTAHVTQLLTGELQKRLDKT